MKSDWLSFPRPVFLYIVSNGLSFLFLLFVPLSQSTADTLTWPLVQVFVFPWCPYKELFGFCEHNSSILRNTLPTLTDPSLNLCCSLLSFSIRLSCTTYVHSYIHYQTIRFILDPVVYPSLVLLHTLFHTSLFNGILKHIHMIFILQYLQIKGIVVKCFGAVNVRTQK